jgi:hypothetical protein
MKDPKKKAALPLLAVGIMGRRKDAPPKEEPESEDEDDGSAVLADLAGEMRSAESDQAFAEALKAFIHACEGSDY